MHVLPDIRGLQDCLRSYPQGYENSAPNQPHSEASSELRPSVATGDKCTPKMGAIDLVPDSGVLDLTELMKFKWLQIAPLLLAFVKVKKSFNSQVSFLLLSL